MGSIVFFFNSLLELKFMVKTMMVFICNRRTVRFKRGFQSCHVERRGTYSDFLCELTTIFLFRG